MGALTRSRQHPSPLALAVTFSCRPEQGPREDASRGQAVLLGQRGCSAALGGEASGYEGPGCRFPGKGVSSLAPVGRG